MPIPLIVPATPEPQTLDEILDWHSSIVGALVEQRASILKAILQSSGVAPRFVGMTEGEIEARYDADRRELDRLTVLNLVASAEGTVKLDFNRRVQGRLKDSLAIAYRKWNKTLSARKQRRPDFDRGGILDVLRDANVMENHIIREYRECLEARHWVAHGRYWCKPVGVDQLVPDVVFDRADAIIRALPA